MEKTMNYIDAMDFLEETKKYGSQLGLTSIQNLMAELAIYRMKFHWYTSVVQMEKVLWALCFPRS